jgi:Bacterial low temperature requirement A protein (LtrA)
MTTSAGVMEEREVSPLELFYDLVFVFAVSQLSEHLVDDLTWRGAAETAFYFAGSPHSLERRSTPTADPIWTARMGANGQYVVLAGLVPTAVGSETVIAHPSARDHLLSGSSSEVDRCSTSPRRPGSCVSPQRTSSAADGSPARFSPPPSHRRRSASPGCARTRCRHAGESGRLRATPPLHTLSVTTAFMPHESVLRRCQEGRGSAPCSAVKQDQR